MKKIFTLLFILFLTSCVGTTKPSQFYTLKPLPADKIISTYHFNIGIEDARIARYLDKPQIVLSQDNLLELRISELNRWVEPLSSLIQQTLCDDLSSLFPNSIVKKRTLSSEKFDYVILFELYQMNGIFEKSASLSGFYSLINSSGDIVARKKVSFSAPLEDTYLDYVQVQSSLLQKTALSIAQEINRLHTSK